MKGFGNIDWWSKLYNIDVFPYHSIPLGFATSAEAIFLSWHSSGSSSSKDMIPYDTRTRTIGWKKSDQVISNKHMCFVRRVGSMTFLQCFALLAKQKQRFTAFKPSQLLQMGSAVSAHARVGNSHPERAHLINWYGPAP